ncbi:MAG: hypothetical protein MJ252_09685 [archaeon]|nr:hypothetical protein [archaeon]
MESYDLNTTFFSIDKTENIFPTLHYKKEFVPVGDSIMMCLAMYWGKRGNQGYSFMKLVEGFPNCSQTEEGKFIWNTEDTTAGVDVPVWKQYINQADCSNEECDEYCQDKYNGYFVDGAKRHVCYSYDVLKKICLVMKYDKNKNMFTYSGGCFKDGLPYEMGKAEMGKVYDFNDIQVSVRDDEDPLIHAGRMSKHSYRFASSWRYFAVFLNILLLANIGLLAYTIYLIFTIRSKQKKPLMESQMNDLAD